ncbi:MAG: choice-of-anchor X domain-containing protein [Phycisphaerales bacterium]
MKFSRLLVVCAGGILGITSAAQAQFVDNCIDATEVNGPGTYPYDLSAASNDGAGTCGASGTAEDVWMLVNPPMDGTIIVETCGLAGGDSVLEAWTSCGETVLACNDDFCGLQSTIFVPVTANTPFKLRVADFAGGTHAGSVFIYYDGANLEAFGTTTPDTISQGASTLFEVAVTPATLPPSTGVAVSCDLALIGGSGNQTMYDDGTNGDAIPGDNVYSFSFTTDANVTPGVYNLAWTASDQESRTVSDVFFLQILPPPPSNDNCDSALTIGAGTTSFDSSSATTDGSATCIGTTSSDIWFRYVPDQTGFITVDACGTSFDTVLTVLDGCFGNELACNDDACGLQSRVANISVTQNSPVIIRVARYYTGTGGPGQVTISVPTPPQWDETAHGGGDSGGLPADAQVPTGTDPFSSINGNVAFSGDADMYRINICDVASFSATTSNADTAGDTSLWLFNSQGIGVAFNDDSVGLLSTLTNAFVTSTGSYYIAVARYDNDAVDEGGQFLWEDTPYNLERAPDGPGAPNAIASWSGASATGAYKISMTGVCFDGGPVSCDPDYNQDGNVDQDDLAYLVNVLGGGENPTNRDPDFNGDGNADQDDYAALLNVIAGGNCP